MNHIPVSSTSTWATVSEDFDNFRGSHKDLYMGVHFFCIYIFLLNSHLYIDSGIQPLLRVVLEDLLSSLEQKFLLFVNTHTHWDLDFFALEQLPVPVRRHVAMLVILSALVRQELVVGLYHHAASL